MIKIRLTGLLQELPRELERLKENHIILCASKPEHNRNSKYFRLYLDVEGIKPEKGAPREKQ
ncbi:MAG: hypothetical protein LKE53_06370 [Oscillospiraceae bacterium]|jgi:hypothetical protein|nr:hypothetical protein [Oscillospiraceae bacterium]